MADFTGGAQGHPLTLTATATGAGPKTGVRPWDAKHVSLQVKGTGAAATAWTVALEGSNNGNNWTTILSHSTTDTDGAVKFAGDNIPRPVTWLRLNVTALTLGTATNIVADAVVVA